MDALTRIPTRAVRGTVGTIKSPSASGKIRGVTGDCGADKSVQNILTHTFPTPGNSPVICKTPEDPEDPSYGGQSAMIRDLTSTAHPHSKIARKSTKTAFQAKIFFTKKVALAALANRADVTKGIRGYVTVNLCECPRMSAYWRISNPRICAYPCEL